MRDFALETYFSKWEFKAEFHMTASDMQSMTLSELLKMAAPEDIEKYNQLWLGYTETWGAPELRQEIAATFESILPQDILCFAGAEEGVYSTMRVLLEQGDHAIVVVPNYQAAETIPLDICDVSGVPLKEENHWHLDIDEVEKLIRPNTKLISINFPNNPTGAIPSRENFNSLVDLCRKYDLYLFSDEVYRLIETEECKRIPQAADIYEKGISLNVCSKAYGFPGLRVGWIACKDNDLLKRLEKYKHYLSICNSAPSEQLAIIVLKNKEIILQKNRALVRENLGKLNQFFEDFPDLFSWQKPDGGCVAYPRFLGKNGVENFCKRLIEEAGVLLLPASIYRSELMHTPADRFRVGFGRENIESGLAQMSKFIASNRHSL
ncbi:MAG: aminotransferase class I/II-fold pyridoxal phosphate-dependent enzyme [Kangiellaceae bacterium]|nr:aminotransferase class I/II-fold pyridoxal phosphate-dependent enzyme [Kangiellaceae bacterium]